MAKARLSKQLHVRVTNKFKEAIRTAAKDRKMEEADLVREAVEKFLSVAEPEKKAA